MKTSHPIKRRGFTLIELSMAMTIGMAVAAMVLALFNNQLTFLRIFRTQNFLVEEAPLISTYVSRMVGRADRFRLHESVTDALANTKVKTTASPVVVLNYRQPDGSMRASMLAFQNLGEGPALYYYVVDAAGAIGNPQWVVTRRPSDVSFSLEQGILRMTITGPQGERITYSGAMQQ